MNEDSRKVRTGNFLTKVEIKYWRVMTDEQILFYQLVQNDLRTCGNIQKISPGQRNIPVTGYLLDYPYLK